MTSAPPGEWQSDYPALETYLNSAHPARAQLKPTKVITLCFASRLPESCGTPCQEGARDLDGGVDCFSQLRGKIGPSFRLRAQINHETKRLVGSRPPSRRRRSVEREPRGPIIEYRFHCGQGYRLFQPFIADGGRHFEDGQAIATWQGRLVQQLNPALRIDCLVGDHGLKQLQRYRAAVGRQQQRIVGEVPFLVGPLEGL